MVVVARNCDGASPTGLVVEAIRLADLRPVWSIPVESVAIDEYTFTISSLGATVVDGDLWAIVGGADFEQPIRSALLHGDRQVETTRSDLWTLGFSVEDLIGDNEANLVLGG